MPVNPTYPGVYIEEIPSGVRSITGVATSVAAFIGNFPRGLQDEAVQLFSLADFEREYGGLHRSSDTSYAIQQFFLNGGSQAHVVRVVHDGSAGGTAAATASIVLTAGINGTGDTMMRLRAGRTIRGEAAVNPGAWGNFLRVEVDYDTDAPTRHFNVTVQEVQVAGDRTTVLQTEVFRNLTMQPDTSNNAVEEINANSRLVVADRFDNAGNPLTAIPDPFVATFRPAPTGTMSDDLPAAPTLPAEGDAFNVSIDGGTAINGTIQLGGATISSYPQLRPFIEQAIRRAALDASVPDAEKPLLAQASVAIIGAGSAANPYRYVVTAGRSARPFSPATELSFTGDAADDAELSGGATVNDAQIPLTGGLDGGPALASDPPVPASAYQGSLSAKTGMYALEDVDIFNILCLPEVSNFGAADMRTVYTQAEGYVEDRRAMLIVDIEADVDSLDEMQTWMADNGTLRHRNAAVYFPRARIPDPLRQNRPRSIGASGMIAGLWARTDTERGVWKAPAGTDARLRGVEALAYNLSDAENGVLNPLGVNCLRNFPIYANICWGARTLEGADVIASDWKYVPVRRTTLFIEESLFRGTKWVVFEPNDEPLWSQIRISIGGFMQDLFRQGAFQGSTPKEAYFVKCDSETTTQIDIDAGRVNIVVGFAPLKPAEFVIIRIQQINPRVGA
jgi:phage tail sheath protein FI